jgi:metal-responsive CopG/Arc/MetJ family transcriptional regulator
MKTAISLPDTLYNDAEKIAKDMGIPRSQLFAKALEEFINHHKKDRITEKINSIYKKELSGGDRIVDVNLESLRELTKNDSW